MAFIKVDDEYGGKIINTDMITQIHKAPSFDNGEIQIDHTKYCVGLADGNFIQVSEEEIKKIFDVIGISL